MQPILPNGGRPERAGGTPARAGETLARAGGTLAFRPIPPPPRPPVPAGRGAAPARTSRAGRAAGGGWPRFGAEAVVGLLALAVIAAVAWPPRPAPLDPAASWSQRAGPAVDALAVDVAAAGRQVKLSRGWQDRLARDLARAGRAGAPPDAPRAATWRRSLGEIRTAVAEARTDPLAARAALDLAGLELSGLAAAAQAQWSGAAGMSAAGGGFVAVPPDRVASAVELTRRSPNPGTARPKTGSTAA